MRRRARSSLSSFTEQHDFPGVLYLEPEPAGRLQELTAAIVRRWPETPPYGGAFDELIPHLTVAQGADEGVLDEIESELARGLPISTRLQAACLYAFDGERWRPRTQLRFRGRHSPG